MGDEKTASRVKAVLPVHTFGQMADMPEILDLADKYDLPVIEDAACALGAALNNRRAGTWGAMGCFSFHPRKAITTGEGGIVTTDDPELAVRLRALRNHGQDPKATTPEFSMPGFNYRMTDFQAACWRTPHYKLPQFQKRAGMFINPMSFFYRNSWTPKGIISFSGLDKMALKPRSGPGTYP
ncbi:MAG: DegT/DnrJ/EryC1/StrS family aminotransferase [Deltaproteobacteria bacterium]|nr:DegT/DnrJ/EryC1/StrS family aminotransferase [Deltaproteobacteria bacterium]